MRASLLQCWELPSDSQPAFSLADFQSCSSGRAEMYTLQKHFYQFGEVILKRGLTKVRQRMYRLENAEL